VAFVAKVEWKMATKIIGLFGLYNSKLEAKDVDLDL